MFDEIPEHGVWSVSQNLECFAVPDEIVVTIDEEDFISAYDPTRRIPHLRNLALLLALMSSAEFG